MSKLLEIFSVWGIFVRFKAKDLNMYSLINQESKSASKSHYLTRIATVPCSIIKPSSDRRREIDRRFFSMVSLLLCFWEFLRDLFNG